MATTIIAKKDLFNDGKCFTEGGEYTVRKDVTNQAGLMDCYVTNDLGEKHLIGGWWREFKISAKKN